MKVKTTIFLLVCFFLVFSIAQGSGENADLKKLAEKVQKAWDDRDMDALVQNYAEDAVMYMPGEPEPVRGRKAIAKNQEAFLQAMPDFKLKLTLVLIQGNHIAFEGEVKGTFTGPLTTPAGEVQPTGKIAKLKFVFIARVNADGLIEEDRTYYDNLDFMQQLGVIK
jgi:steroid delta-isomerase-like uncharacterized protein